MEVLEMIVLGIFGWEKSRNNERYSAVDIWVCFCSDKETFVAGEVPDGYERIRLERQFGVRAHKKSRISSYLYL